MRRLLDQAREEGQWHAYQAEAAALCFDVLALFPECEEAAELVRELFRDEWLIYENRLAIQRHIEEWDDRPWQQRRRMALSCRFMSRWDGWHREYEQGYEHERDGPPDVAGLLDEGRGLLLHAYCLGDEESSDMAWPAFVSAFRRTTDPRTALLWVGKLYVDLGFFADAVEVLAELCSRFDDADARRLLAEARWWRDSGHAVPWLPPPGDGSRYRRMMAAIDPEVPSDDEVIRQLRSRAAAARGEAAAWQPALDPTMAALIAAALPPIDAPSREEPALVDWSFLDQDDGQPGEPPAWVIGLAEEFPPEMADAMIGRYRWTRPIAPPQHPRRYKPGEAPSEF
jgi:hypothetical protein